MKSEDKPRQCVERQIHHSADKGNVKAMLFPVNWTIKKAECQRIDAFELWCWRRLLRVPWTGRRSNQSIFFFSPNQSILREISPECSLEGLILKLKLQYFGHLM